MKIVIDGDSITSAGRDYDNLNDLGHGYAYMIQQELKDISILNLGVSGNRSFELLSRFKDTLKENPDIITILIGVNDVWHSKAGKKAPTTPKDFYHNMVKLLDEVKKNHREITVILLEPFVLQTGHVQENWLFDLNEIREMIKGLSKDYGYPFVPLQEAFINASKRSGMTKEDYLKDGVHPTTLGHELIKKQLLVELRKHM